MARPQAEEPRIHPVCVRLTLDQREQLDEMRGETPASEYIRTKLFPEGT